MTTESRPEELARRLADVGAATRRRDKAAAAKQDAADKFNQAVNDCRAHGFDWQLATGDPVGCELRSVARAAYLSHDARRRALAVTRRQLDSAYRALGKAVAS